MAQFRTYNEVNEIYNKLSHLPGKGHPYCITLHKPNRYFGFIGTSHQYDPKHHQWKRFFEEWDIFLQTKNHKKVVFHEGKLKIPVAKNKTEAIEKGGDSGTTAWLADKAGITYVSPEPSRSQEISALKKLGFKEDELITYYVGRQVAHWHRYDKKIYPDIDDYIFLTLKNSGHYNWDIRYKVANVRKMIEAHLDGLKVENASISQFNQFTIPHLSPVSKECNNIRDRKLFGEIVSHWRKGEDIFCVYGSGHAIVLEPALKELINGV